MECSSPVMASRLGTAEQAENWLLISRLELGKPPLIMQVHAGELAASCRIADLQGSAARTQASKVIGCTNCKIPAGMYAMHGYA